MALIGEDGQYTGEHSISINDRNGNKKNTAKDWHLVPAQRPIVNPPEVKTKILENPGGDGIIDLSYAITGFPIYGQRKGSWEFYVLNDWHVWYDLYSDMLNFFHGKDIQVILEDDIQYYYNGRITFNQWASDPGHSKITLDYELDPYKLSRYTSLDSKWIWDTFCFPTDVISKSAFSKMPANGTKTYTFTGRQVGRRPVTPEFIIESGTVTSIRLINKELGIDVTKTGSFTTTDSNHNVEGSYHFEDLIFSGFSDNNTVKIVFKGNSKAVVSISYRPGKL